MSVIVISPQMIADAVKKAHTFLTEGNSHDEEMMCPILAKINKNDKMNNTDEIKFFFFNLYRWNIYTYEKMYNEGKFSSFADLQEQFEKAMNHAKDIDIYQFEFILHFLEYNIDSHAFYGGSYFFDISRMESDLCQLIKIRNQVCKRIVTALAEQRGAQYYYYD